MRIIFLAPFDALVGLVAIPVLIVAFLGARRLRRLEHFFGGQRYSWRAWLPAFQEAIGDARHRHRWPRLRSLPKPPLRQWGCWSVVVMGLLTFAAAQPILVSENTRYVRSDAKICYAIDASRSMLAASSPRTPSRWERATDIVLELEQRLPDVPACLASFTDEAFLHLPKTEDRVIFSDVLRKAMGVEKPPPGLRRVNATDLDVIASFAARGYFRSETKKRILVMVTDGETNEVDIDLVRKALTKNRVHLVLVHVWRVHERVFTDGKAEEKYDSDPQARQHLREIAAATESVLITEDGSSVAIEAIRDRLGDGPREAVGRQEEWTPLAPLAVGLALFFVLFWIFRTKF